MIPVTLKIEGFLSYREPVVLDFTGFSLACISGLNGAGKSSLLDAITWALFGQARKHDESVINSNPAVKAAEVTLDFDYEGNRYRVMRTNPRGKTASVEFFIRSQVEGEEERWKTLTERTLRETNAKIEQTLRLDYETFTNASFFLQGKADQFAVAAPAKRKEILSSILGLEVWEKYREVANQRRRDLEKESRGLDGRLEEIQVELDQEDERKARLAELQTSLAELAKQRQEREEILKGAQSMHTLLNTQREQLETMKTRLKSVTHNRDSTLETLENRRAEKAKLDQILTDAAAIETAYRNWQTSRTELESLELLATQYREHQALQEVPRRLIAEAHASLTQEQQGLEKMQKDLEANLAQREQFQLDLQKAQEKIDLAKAQLERRAQWEENQKGLQEEYAHAKAENSRLAKEGPELNKRIEKLEETEDPACPLCSQPLSQEERGDLVRSLVIERDDLRERYQKNLDIVKNYESELRKLGAELADLRGADADLRNATRVADQLSHQLEKLDEAEQQWSETGALRLVQITTQLTEEAYAEEARGRLGEIDAEMKALGYDLEAHKKLRLAEQSGREAELQFQALGQAKGALAPIEQHIVNLETQLEAQKTESQKLTEEHDATAAALAAAEATMPNLAEAETALHDKQEDENRKRLEVGAAEQKVTVLETQKERKAELLEERESISRRIGDLKQLEVAFGKSGVPALLIEQALPELEQTANELLSRLTNDRMTLSFQTQREYKDSKRGDRKETLDLVISDSVGERDYEMFSGGEAFRVNFSIRLALSKVLAQRAGARLQTLVIDEGFSSQDAQGRQRLVEAINLVRDDFEKILVITHLEELKDAFPTRIEVEKTERGSQLRVI